MELNAQQKEAVEYLSGPLLVLAGPGTGKTQLLSQKVAYILKNTDASPENILCLTFTETGAANMRERLKSIIGKDALKVTIGTYHAFGTEILSLYKNYATNYNRRLDAAIDELAQYKIIKSLQESLNGNDILHGDKVKDIISVISEAKAARLSADDLANIAKINIEDSFVLSSAISPLLLNVVPRVFRTSLEQAYLPIYDLLRQYQNSEPIVKNIYRTIVLIAKDLEAAIDEAEALNKITPLTDWRNKYFEKSESGDYRLKDRVANLKLKSVAEIMKKYETFLEENGLFDFDDMIEEARKALASDAGFRMSLQEKYQYIMLDEFQDTNPSQFGIVKELTDYEKPMIMAVGDDDQAIYEFQGALSTNLTDFRDHYDAHVVTLVDNYRSTGEILDFSRKIINQTPDRFMDKELISHKSDPKQSEIRRLEFLSSDAEFSFVAEKIAELIKNGVPQKEIAVISYKLKYFEPLLAYLKSYPEIKIAYDKRDNLFDDEKMSAIFNLSRLVYEIINEKRPSVSMMEILSYPYFKIPKIEVLRLAIEAKESRRPILDCIASSEIPEIKGLAELLGELVAKGASDSLSLFLDFLIEKTVRPDNLESYEAFTFYENYAALLGKLKKHYGDKKLRLEDLVALIDDYEAASMPMNITSPYRDALDAVQVMSAHKAKGLEFEYVFIISADHTAWGKGKGNNNLLSLPKNLTQIRHTGMTDSERLRVLYVALTRAKKSLYITNSVTDFDGKSPERLEYLNEFVNEEKILTSPLIPSGVVDCQYDLKPIEKMTKDLRRWLKHYLELTPDMREIYRERVTNLRMSASALTTFIDICYSGPQEFFKRYLLNVPSGPETEQMVFGNLIHATFQKMTEEKINSDQAIKFYLDELEKADIQEETKRKLAERGLVCIEKSSSNFERIIYDGKSEVNFSADKIVVDGVPVTGKVDHMLIDDKNKIIEVFDFKTGKYHKGSWKSQPNLYQYMLQLQFYKMLINNSRLYKDYEVTCGHILFVSPDKDGEVHEKAYQFNEEDEADFLQLLKSVYKLIFSLDFMSNPDIFIEPNDKYTLVDMKKFIELVLANNQIS